MKDEGNNREKRDRVDDEAVDWVMKRERGFTPSEQDAFLEWLAADPLHGERYARQGRSWLESNLLAEWRPEHGDRPNPDLLARQTAGPAWFKPVWVWSSAAAAAVIILALVIFDFGENPSSNGRDVTRVSSERYAYQSLEDGSEIDLNDGAELIIDYTDERRLVELRSGEAHFTVASDPDRPFVVKVGSAQIRAVGTAFNVRRESDQLELLVTEGKVVWGLQSEEAETRIGVKASIEALSREVGAGHRSVLHWDRGSTEAPEVERVQPEEIERILHWKPVMLQFMSTPLAEAVGEINRLNNTQIVLKDESLASLVIVASVRSNRIDEFIRLLELALEIESKKVDDGEIHLYAKN